MRAGMVAGGYLGISAGAAAALSVFSWPLPHQLVGSAPWVDRVPVVTLLGVAGLAAVLAAGALGLLRRLTRPLVSAGRTLLIAAVMVFGCLAGCWGALYTASIDPSEPVIPILDWLFTAVPVFLVSAIVVAGSDRRTAVAAGVLAAAPMVAVNMLGWGLRDGAAAAASALLFNIVGVGIGLTGALLGPGRPVKGPDVRPA